MQSLIPGRYSTGADLSWRSLPPHSYGHNALRRAAGPSLWLRFLSQFRNLQAYLLLAASVASLLV
jgi:hypothetical protein